MNKTLTDQQLIRYSRHIMLPAMDIQGQEKLWNSHALIVGVGGLGCAASQYLVAAGIGEITLVDDDNVELSNIQRQILHHQGDIGKSKCDSAKETLNQINSEVKINRLNKRLDATQLRTLLKTGVNIILDCSDNLKTRLMVNAICFAAKTPLIFGAAIRMEGQVSCFTMQNDDPCYQCLSHSNEERQLSCSESGVLSPLVGIVGAIQATECIKILANIGKPLSSRLLLIDALTMEFKEFMLAKNNKCQVCGDVG